MKADSKVIQMVGYLVVKSDKLRVVKSDNLKVVKMVDH
jgi:hypothetical protein